MSEERKSRWGVELQGQLFDLEDWEEDLKPPFDPSVVVLPDKNKPDTCIRVLHSASFDACTSASEVREVAIPLVRTLSGLLGVRRGAMPVTIGNVIEFRADGSWNSHAFIEGAQLMGRAKSRGVGVVLVNGVVQEPPPPTTSYAQSMIHGLSDHLRAALRYYDMADNWYDLYKAYEAVLSHLYPLGKHTEQQRKKASIKTLRGLGFTDKELSDLSESAQPHRHYTTPARPILNFHDAKALTRRIIDAVLHASCGP